MNDNSNSNVEGAQIIKRMGSLDTRERADAERLLHERGLDTIESLFALLNTERRRWRKIRRRFRSGKYVVIAVLGLQYGLRHEHLPSAWLTIASILLPDFFFMMWFLHIRDTFQRGISLALSRFDHVSVIGPLIDLYSEALETKEFIAPALIRLLPRLQSTDTALLTTGQREHLYRILDMCSSRLVGDGVNVELMIAIFKALEQIGDEKALAHVEPLAQRHKRACARSRARLPAFYAIAP